MAGYVSHVVMSICMGGGGKWPHIWPHIVTTLRHYRVKSMGTVEGSTTITPCYEIVKTLKKMVCSRGVHESILGFD